MSGAFHALLLGVLLLLVGSAVGPPDSIRVRLVTEIKPLSVSPQASQMPATPIPPPVAKPRSRPGPDPAPAPAAPKAVASQAFSTEPRPPADLDAPMPERPMEAWTPSRVPPEGGAADGPPGLMGEGQARPPISPPGTSGLQAEAKPPPEERLPIPPASHLEATAGGRLLATGGGGSGTGERGGGVAAGGTGTGQGGGAGHPGGGGRAKAGDGRRGGGVTARGSGGGAGDGQGVVALLRLIRRRIEEAKTYPDAARRQGIQGTVELRFRIADDGSVEVVEILRSSGHPALDEISKQTIQRASPYPTLKGWIRIPLSYRLDQ